MGGKKSDQDLQNPALSTKVCLSKSLGSLKYMYDKRCRDRFSSDETHK